MPPLNRCRPGRLPGSPVPKSATVCVSPNVQCVRCINIFSYPHICMFVCVGVCVRVCMLVRPHLDMLSGEQAELLPVEMLVSMLSELSRLSVS